MVKVKNHDMKVWVLIPAYNEEKTLGEILEVLNEKGLFTLVVDDGSTDRTLEVAKEKNVVLIRNKRNSGKGVSLKNGIGYLLANKELEYIIIMDADSQHSPLDLDKFLEQAKNGESFVVGNRMKQPSGMPLIRIFTNRFMSWVISKIIKQEIPDTQCGFRLIKKTVLENITIETDKYQIESEILIKAANKGVRIKSIPVRSIYSKDMKSKINPVKDTLRFIRFILNLNYGKKQL